LSMVLLCILNTDRERNPKKPKQSLRE